MEKNVEKAFDFAQEATKQLISLATGIIALTITFLKEIVKTAPSGSGVYLQISWVMYLVSIVFGVFTLLSLTGNLERPENGVPSVYGGAIRLGSIAQILTFTAALILTLIFGFKAV